VTGFEPATSTSRTNESSDVSANIIALTASAPAVCTSVCTSDAENANDDQHGGTIRLADPNEHGNTVEGNAVAELAAGLLALTPEQRQELAKLLAGVGSS